MIDRRRFIVAGTASAAVLGTGTFALSRDPFQTLRAAPAKAQLAPPEMSGPADVWAYDGTVPGREVRLTAGERVRVRLDNGLEQTTSVHWHGIRIDNAMDGVPGITQETVQPGGTFDYDFVAPDPGTYWYHTHDRSWEQMARGLYGPLIVEEHEPPKGIDREITLVFDDWLLTREGKLDEASLGNLGEWAHGGRMGNTLTINGQSAPEIGVRAGERLRIRMINAANARIMAFQIPEHPIRLIALDGYPVTPRRAAEDAVVLAPAQRADILLDCTAEPGSRTPLLFVALDEPIEAASFVYSARKPLRTSFLEPSGLPPSSAAYRLDLDAATEVPLLMEGGAMGSMRGARFEGRDLDFRELVAEQRVWAFNGVAGDMIEPMFRASLGQTVKIAMQNDTRWSHGMHMHGHHFKVLERDGKPDPTQDWRDTALVLPQERVTIAFQASNPGKWLFHCHMVEHMAGGMTTWFEVG